MKKFLVLLLAVLMVFAFAACANSPEEPTPADEPQEEVKDDPTVKGEGVMTYAEYAEAAIDADVVIEGYVQAKQGWWDNKSTMYLADADGAYYVYQATCTKEQDDSFIPGAKVKVTGKKAEWSGEVEIAEATVELEEGSYIAEAFDATSILADEAALIANQNRLVKFTGLTVEAKKDADGKELAFFYNWDNSGEEGSDADLYVDLSKDGKTYSFSVEYYLTDENSDVYQAVQALNVGDTVDAEGFLYWYDGPSVQLTSVTVA